MKHMVLKRLLVANRGEIAIRILRSAAQLRIPSVALYSEDDARSLHIRRSDAAVPLQGRGVAPYLDIDKVIAAARTADCDAIHPGYGFLSESAAFARRCALEGIAFVGPDVETLETFGDKARALELARRCGVPVSRGTATLKSAGEAGAFLASLGKDGVMVIKAVAGGGGRGIRVVRSAEEVEKAWQRCQSEALAAFGCADVYAEAFVAQARHVEVQVIGDGTGDVSHIWERECSIQRQHQKIVEFAPSLALSDALRDRLTEAALSMARAVDFRGLGTFEFLVSGEDFVFIEANPRLQVEHTVTEQITRLDLVALQLQVAAGATLADLGMKQANVPAPRGFAMQLRINMERLGADGSVRPSSGTISAFEPPAGPGIRVDSFAYAGYETSARFDSLLAKLIAWSPEVDFAGVAQAAYRALCEFRLEGVETNIGFLQNLLCHPAFLDNRLHTRFVDEHIAELAAPGGEHQKRFFTEDRAQPGGPQPGQAGGRVDRSDPLAVFGYAKDMSRDAAQSSPPVTPSSAAAGGITGPAGTVAVRAPIQGTVIAVDVAEGQAVAGGQQVMVMESMKMEHVVAADCSGIVRRVAAAMGDTVLEGHALLFIEEGEAGAEQGVVHEEMNLDYIRTDLAELQARKRLLLDEARPEAIAQRRAKGQRTARENVNDLLDPGSFTEFAGLAIGAMHERHAVDTLIRSTPADGLITGVGRVNGEFFEASRTQCAVLAYDYTVFAGTQSHVNHKKMDRLLTLAWRGKLPTVLFSEGGGARPGEDRSVPSSQVGGFTLLPRMSGRAPLVGVNAGYCFAGNAAFLGCCDVIIATRNSNIGMGGPAMIEGGGLGVYRPEEIGPSDVQARSGVIDVLVEDEAEAVRVAKRYLSYFQGPVREWQCTDQRRLRALIPDDRRRVYEIRAVIEALADAGSVLELRREFGIGIVTALARIEGHPIGILANNPKHLGGAVDSDGADKGARFMQLCDTFGIALLSLCDTPGIMVGPEAEKTGLVRHSSRLLLTGANLGVPMFSIILRKGYGIGKIAMMGGGIRVPFFTVSWPTGEFANMNVEGLVKLGYRKDLAAIADPAERLARYEAMVAAQYAKGKALPHAANLGLDDVIDPADSRRWIVAGLMATESQSRDPQPYVDAW